MDENMATINKRRTNKFCRWWIECWCFVDTKREQKFGMAHRPVTTHQPPCVPLLYNVCTWDDSSLKSADYSFTKVSCVLCASCVHHAVPRTLDGRSRSKACTHVVRRTRRHLSRPRPRWISMLCVHELENFNSGLEFLMNELHFSFGGFGRAQRNAKKINRKNNETQNNNQ